MTNLENIWGEMEEQSNLDSDFLKLAVGKNPIRILSDFVKVESVYKGKYPNSTYQGIKTPDKKIGTDETVTMQAWAWVIDRKTGQVKIAQFGQSIIKAIIALKTDPEYAFKDFPMEYDININNTGDGANRYSVIAARQNTPVTEAEMTELNKKKPIRDIIQAIVDKQNKPVDEVATRAEYPTEENNFNDDIFDQSSEPVIS